MVDCKTCTKCHLSKSLDSFYHEVKGKYGRRSVCIPCFSAKSDQSKEKERDYRRVRYNIDPEVRKRAMKNQYEYRQRAHATIDGRFRHLFWNSKSRAAKKKLNFDLDLQWLVDLYHQQNGKCSVSGITLDFTLPKDVQTHIHPFSPSIDRKDPSKGYTKDNVRIVCALTNGALNDFGEDAFREVCYSYVSLQKQELPL